MPAAIKQAKATNKLLWIAGFLLLIICFLAYYQLRYKSKEVNSNIFQLRKTLIGNNAEIWTVKFAPGGTLLASGGVDSTVRIWNKESGNIISTLKQPSGVTYLDFSPAGNYLVTVSYDSKARLWKLPEGILLKEFVAGNNTVWTVSFSPDGKMIATAGEDATINIWNIETGQLIKTFKGHERNIWDVKFSPDGKLLASGSFDNTIKIWSLAEGKLIKTLTTHTEAVVALAFSHDGTKLASTSDDKTIKLWNTSNWSLVYSLEVPEHAQAVDFSPDDKKLLTGGHDKTMLGEFLQNFFGDSKHNKGVSMRLWDVQTGDLLQTFSQHGNDVNDVAYCPDGKWIASASSDKTIQLWQLVK